MKKILWVALACVLLVVIEMVVIFKLPTSSPVRFLPLFTIWLIVASATGWAIVDTIKEDNAKRKAQKGKNAPTAKV